MPAKAFRIKRQNQQGETLHVPDTNACRACYKPIPSSRDPYCSDRCAEAHQRLNGRASFACAIDETAA